ncbi:MAG: hypothetical protein GF317_25165 [Candidatus Lokiarchaeota archaeon]|nr:hypothetical protein [Candidatus Lokiarchaeota archaeon]MBD3202650.1 hypothetical protein [Candidatus Lokiarchaeota archaeon]
MFSKEDVQVLAYRLYKSDEPYERAIWRLAELCVTINKNIENGYDISPLENEHLVLLLRNKVNGSLLKPSEEEIRRVAEIIYNQGPEKSKLHFYIAEKTLLLEEIKALLKAKN